jgi:hypothetical protein
LLNGLVFDFLGDILADEATFIAANKHIEFKTLDPIQVKGKGTPIPVFVPFQVAATKYTLGSTGNARNNVTQRAVIGRDKLLGLIDHKIRMLKQKNGVGNGNYNRKKPTGFKDCKVKVF